MKNVWTAAIAALLAAAFTAGAIELLRERRPPATESREDRSAGRDPELGRRIDEIADRLAALEGARSAPARELVSPQRVAEQPASSVVEEAIEFASAPPTEEEESDPAPQDDARTAHLQERFRRQAEDIGQELGLGDMDREAVFDVLLEEFNRRAKVFEAMRDQPFEEDFRVRVRERMAEIQTWKSEELTAKLGAELCSAVLTYERENHRGSFGRNPGREPLEEPGRQDG